MNDRNTVIKAAEDSRAKADYTRTTFCASYHQLLSSPTEGQLLLHFELGLQWLRAEEEHELAVGALVEIETKQPWWKMVCTNCDAAARSFYLGPDKEMLCPVCYNNLRNQDQV